MLNCFAECLLQMLKEKLFFREFQQIFSDIFSLQFLFYISVQEVSETPAESTAPAAGKHGAYILRCWHVELGSMQKPFFIAENLMTRRNFLKSWFWLRFQVIWLQLKTHRGQSGYNNSNHSTCT